MRGVEAETAAELKPAHTLRSSSQAKKREVGIPASSQSLPGDGMTD